MLYLNSDNSCKSFSKCFSKSSECFCNCKSLCNCKDLSNCLCDLDVCLCSGKINKSIFFKCHDYLLEFYNQGYRLPKIVCNNSDLGLRFVWDLIDSNLCENKRLTIEIGLPYQNEVEWHFVDLNCTSIDSGGVGFPPLDYLDLFKLS